MKRIGIDVGGTNTDAVLIENNTVIAAVKCATSDDVTSGIRHALADLIRQMPGSISDIHAVMIGTTHYTNAVIQRRDLQHAAAVRISLPASASLQPFCDWPADLAEKVNGGVYLVHGGHEYDGREIVPLNENEIAEAARAIRRSGVNAVAVSATFSPLSSTLERRAEKIIRIEHPDATITLSSTLGRIGLLERENVALLNASLQELATKTTDAFFTAIAASGIDAELYITQNDGTVARAENARRFPVFSFASGPTNSMRGAALLSGIDRAIVCDIGGTTSDIGFLENGFPREANSAVHIGGVRTLFRMPELFSVGIGGGTIISTDGKKIGPRSVGFRLQEQALSFGGGTLTASDIASAASVIDIGDHRKVNHLMPELVQSSLAGIHAILANAVDRMRIDPNPIPLLAVGGAARMLPTEIPGISDIVHVEHQAVANAVGAAVAQISGEADKIFRNIERAEAIADARQHAIANAKNAGADPESIRIVEQEDLPLSYLPGRALRVRVRAVGDVANTLT